MASVRVAHAANLASGFAVFRPDPARGGAAALMSRDVV